MRHENLNATSFFDNKFGREKPLSRTQTRGLTIGGPAYIPGMFNIDKKKLFFFFSTSQQPFKLPPPLHQIQMPTDLERQGDFSQSFAQNGCSDHGARSPDRTAFPRKPDSLDPSGAARASSSSISSRCPIPAIRSADGTISRAGFSTGSRGARK